MNVLCNRRSAFRCGILVFLLLASPCNAASVDIIFASDFQNSQPIQWVRHHPKAGGASIALGPAYVTAMRVTGGGTLLTLYLQVPPQLNGNADYPLWSALKTFGDLSGPRPPLAIASKPRDSSRCSMEQPNWPARSGRPRPASAELLRLRHMSRRRFCLLPPIPIPAPSTTNPERTPNRWKACW
jgi:hypothetical protein